LELSQSQVSLPAFALEKLKAFNLKLEAQKILCQRIHVRQLP
jgi:hypothetical protein